MNRIVKEWIEKANHDLQAAHYLLDMEDLITDVIAFHFQQAVEKYLKAYLTYFNIRVSKTHDLIVILNQCIEHDFDFKSFNSDILIKLTDCGVMVRYPDDFYELSLNEVQEFSEVASFTKDFVLKKLNG